MSHLHSKQSLQEFSDRELQELILSNQIVLFRQTQYILNHLNGKGSDSLGFFRLSFEDMIRNVDDILKQSNDYLKQSDTEKGFFKM